MRLRGCDDPAPITAFINAIVLAVDVRPVTELKYPQLAMNGRRTEINARNAWPASNRTRVFPAVCQYMKLPPRGMCLYIAILV